MTFIAYFILAIYMACLIYIMVYCLMQFHLLLHYRKFKKHRHQQSEDTREMNGHFPMVTIQLPIFNEYYVVERLIDKIMELDYPRDRFEVHVLDDSTDETTELSKAKVDYYKSLGYRIKLIQRDNRKGYKAGALKDAMQYAKGEFIAIFDADFLPERDFLKQTIPYFEDPGIGVVQTRWGHINQKYSLLTELQAFQLNVHFTVEQQGRESGDLLLQFNGTAGVWRKTCIDDAGGWEADTLTEDLDLSYRAQLKGWKINYLEDILSPAELPVEMIGLKSQQYRWMKGGAETAKKLLPIVWSSPLRFNQKMHATSHLLGSSIFLFVFILGVFSVPLLLIINPLNINLSLMGIFVISTMAIIAVYFVANVENAWDQDNKLRSIVKFIGIFPLFLALSMGLSLHNSLAVLQGYRGKKSSFVRTPKFNIKDLADKFTGDKYLAKKLPPITIFEGLLALYFLIAIVLGFYIGDTSLLIFHILLFVGYSAIFIYSIKHLQHQAS